MLTDVVLLTVASHFRLMKNGGKETMVCVKLHNYVISTLILTETMIFFSSLPYLFVPKPKH